MKQREFRCLLFDIGGVLSLAPNGTEPAEAFRAMFARWEERQRCGGRLSAKEDSITGVSPDAYPPLDLRGLVRLARSRPNLESRRGAER